MRHTLQPGPLDIVGDIHGELDALQALLATLGYDSAGHHPQDRHLVFVGDLVDRGPDSPGVVRLVRRLVEAGRAQMVLGNHEINLLRHERKTGNDWFWDESSPRDARYSPYQRSQPPQDPALLAWLDTLPLALERDDLRVVHAAWHEPSLQRLAQAIAPGTPVSQAFTQCEAASHQAIEAAGLPARARADKDRWHAHMHDSQVAMPMLTSIGTLDAARQMGNPLRVLTSGLETCTTQPFFANHEWRFAERVRWWEHYTDPVPVVMGHYWRQYIPLDRAALGKGDPDLFAGTAPQAWLGPQGRVFCVDFSVGGRWQERGVAANERRTRLAALRWPERVLVLDSGEQVETTGCGAA